MIRSTKRYTEADIATAIKNGVPKRNFVDRVNRGMPITEAQIRPVGKPGGECKYPKEWVAQAAAKGINKKLFYKRMDARWTPEEAINTPPYQKPKATPETPMTDEEVVACLGRIKYMRQHRMDYPLPFPKPMLKKIQKLGLSLEDIEPLEVHLDGQTAKGL
ncbi:hypothetical protein J4760_04165 [Salinicoccus sp. ID82-1]|uniref:hypothetical protein n=1 Tax=Salinicoccus sp. ID82-1 TaxID=2820269 RepID=UPI001F34C4C8|nr:hypothetical protein [Salinicoccus sp. ID82-1]MCG1009247.1 hypothetical protein [Salinicoccus sp. ID82-1]